MKIDVCSDLHVEKWFGKIVEVDGVQSKMLKDGATELRDQRLLHFDFALHKNPDSDVLIIAGDVSDDPLITIEVVKEASAYYELVIFVDGNHDNYDRPFFMTSNLQEAPREQKRTVKQLSNVYWSQLNGFSNKIRYLGQSYRAFEHDGILFAGSNFWYDWRCYENTPEQVSRDEAFEFWNRRYGDKTKINFGIGAYQEHPKELGDYQILKTGYRIEEFQRMNLGESSSLVIISHTVPLPELLRKGDREWNVGSPSYCHSNAKHLLQYKPNVWIYGHTHDRNDSVIDGVRFVNNARGLFGEISEPFRMKQIEVFQNGRRNMTNT